jgi:hypothetical protein
VCEAVGDRLGHGGCVAVKGADRERGEAAGLLGVVDRWWRLGGSRGVLEPVGGLLVGERQPLVGVVAAGFAVGMQGEVAPVKASGGGGVDRRDQLLGEGGTVVCGGREEVQDIGGDGEADQARDRGRQQRDRALGGLLADG